MQASRYSTSVLPVDNPQAFLTAVSLLRSGEVIAFPTDTVYGVGCDLWQPAAVERIYRIKQRPLNMAIPLLVAGMSSVQQVSCNLGSTFFLLAEHFWPGELTLIVPRLPSVPDVVTAGGDTVALRMPAYQAVLELCEALGGALAVTSANLSGSPACVTAEEVLRDLGGHLPLILDGGPCSGGVASTIVNCTVEPPRVLRLRNLTLEMLQKVIPNIQYKP